MDKTRTIFFLTNTIFSGFLLSALYGALSAATIWYFRCDFEVTRYAEAYFKTFNSAVSGGLVFATALLVYRTQNYIPRIIEKTFLRWELEKTPYNEIKCELFNGTKSAILCSSFGLLGLLVFYYAGFPLDNLSKSFLITAGGLQYAAGVYIGRKLFYVAHLRRSIESAQVTEDVFKKARMFGVSLYVNCVSTITAIAVYIGVRSYYKAPFAYDSLLGEALATAMFIPAIIAIPVLLFAYYSRISVRRVYEQAIERSLAKVGRNGKEDGLSSFQIQTGTVELEKRLRDELNYRLRATLEDLPMVVIVGIALLGAFKS